MDFTPGDLALSVNDLFGILLPGGMLLLLLAFAEEKRILPRLKAISDDKARWLAFLLVAYLLGNLVGLVSPRLTSVYTHAYRPLFGKSVRSYQDRATVQARNYLHEGYSAGDDIALWARSVVVLKNPAAAATLDRLDANARSFRSLTIVCLFGGVWFLWRRRWAHSAIFLCLMTVCLFEFFDLQVNRETQTYQYFIAIATAPAAKSPADPK